MVYVKVGNVIHTHTKKRFLDARPSLGHSVIINAGWL